MINDMENKNFFNMESEVVKLSYYIFDKVLFVEPIIESVINSIQAGADYIKINTSRNSDVIENQIIKIEIQDNGIGFNLQNRQNFNKIAETSKKVEKCRGIGRLSYLRIFDRVFFCSNCKDKDNEKYYNVRFFFNNQFTKIEHKDDRNIKSTNDNEIGTKIIFDKITQNLSENDKKILKYDSRALLKHIISNKDSDTFSSIIFTTLSKAKDISISVDSESATINATNIAWQEAEYEYGVHKINIKYAFHNFDNDIFNDSDYIAYQVGDRAVKEVFPVQKKFEFKDDNKGKSLICFVKCELLDNTTNNNWKNFNLSRDDWRDFKKFVKEKIYNDIILQNLESDIADTQKQQAIIENPHLKLLLKKYDKSLFFKKDDAVDRAINEKERILKDYFSSKSENLFNEENINIIQQSALAELMISRFRTLENAYNICNEKTPDGKYAKEDEIHNLLMPKGTINAPNNLWLLDARWQYANLISSDNTIKKSWLASIGIDGKFTDNLKKHKISLSHDIEKSLIDEDFLNEFNKEPDIAIFNEESVIIIELKKPNVDLSSYIYQPQYYAQLISYLSNDKYKRFYCYLVGSNVPPNSDYTLTVDKQGRFKTIPKMSVTVQENGEQDDKPLGSSMYFEVCTYNKFLKDCYMQHHPFFEKIGKKIEALDKYIPKKNNS